MSLSIENEGPLERSLEELVGPSKSAMVYGFQYCSYYTATNRLRHRFAVN